MRDAQRLGHQRRHVLVADAVDERYTPHHLVAIGNPVDRPDAGRGLVELRQVGRRARETRARRASGRRRRSRIRPSPAARPVRWLRMVASTVGVSAIALASTSSCVGWLPMMRRQRRRLLRRHQLDRLFRRGAVRLGKQDVEGDDRGALVAELLQKVGDHGPRPRPLPDLGKQFLVDVDDPHRLARIVIPRASRSW